MDFINVTSIIIPQGKVNKILVGNVVYWKKTKKLPNWEENFFGLSNIRGDSYAQRMYYGSVVQGTNNWSNNALLWVGYNSSTSNKLLYQANDGLLSVSSNPIATLYDVYTVYQYYPVRNRTFSITATNSGKTYSGTSTRLYLIADTKENNASSFALGGVFYYEYRYFPNRTNFNGFRMTSAGIKKECVCMTYLPLVQKHIVIQSNGTILSMGNTAINFSQENTSVGINVNPSCIAWSPNAQVFCVTGTTGTATSPDGLIWTTHTNADVPQCLVDLSFRDDLDCFFARGETDKLFYVSSDGIMWQTLNQTPIPLATVKAVDYNSDTGWYCAVGGTGQYVYFSNDLENWIPSKITDRTITAQSVIYIPLTGTYVLMSNSENRYYTFTASALANL